MSPGSTGTRGLRDGRAVVEFGGDEMHRRAVLGHAGGQRLGMRGQAGKQRQQRRVDIQHAAGVVLDERRRQDAHEAGQHDQVGRVAVDFGLQYGVELGAGGVILVRHHRRRNSVRGRERQPGGVGCGC